MEEHNQTSSSFYTILFATVFLLACTVSIFPNILLATGLTVISLILSVVMFASMRNRGTQFLLLYAVLFIISAAIGYWAAHNQDQALQKLLVLTASVTAAMAISTKTASPSQKALVFATGSVFFGLVFVGSRLLGFEPGVALTSNRLAGLSAIFTPFLLYLFIEHGNRLVKGGAILGFFFSILCLFVAQSRGAILAVGIGVLVWFLLAPPIKFNRMENLLFGRAVLWGSIGLGLIAFAFSALSQNTFLNSIAGADTRIELYTNSKYLIESFWVFGGGLDSFAGLYSQYIVSVPFLLFTYGHHLFADILLEQGILGLLSFGTIAFGTFWHGSRLKLEHPGQKAFLGASLASLTILLLHGFIDDAAYGDFGSAVLFIPAASILSLSHKDSGANFRPAHIVFGCMFAAAAVIAIITPAARSNLAAIQLAQVQLDAWPTNEWSRGENNCELELLIPTYEQILSISPGHPATNYQLGLVHMELHNFAAAENHLAIALDRRPGHPSIIKNLGYARLWQGDIDGSKKLLTQIDGIDGEIEAYVWWWDMLGKKELSQLAQTYENTP